MCIVPKKKEHLELLPCNWWCRIGETNVPPMFECGGLGLLYALNVPPTMNEIEYGGMGLLFVLNVPPTMDVF